MRKKRETFRGGFVFLTESPRAIYAQIDPNSSPLYQMKYWKAETFLLINSNRACYFLMNYEAK